MLKPVPKELDLLAKLIIPKQWITVKNTGQLAIQMISIIQVFRILYPPGSIDIGNTINIMQITMAKNTDWRIGMRLEAISPATR